MRQQETRRPRGEPPTYYDLPVLKSPHWDWKVSAYIFAAGLSGGAQMVSTVVALSDRDKRSESVVRNGRYLALLGSLVSAPLLIADLKTPKRWYNMLRIFRPTSPMSIGTYILSFFGMFSGVTALGQFLQDSGARIGGWIASAAQWPAAAIGAGMSCYAGTLMSATSTPLWAAAPRLLTARLAASSMAMGAAALSLGELIAGDDKSSRGLDRIACLGAGLGLGLTLLAKQSYRRQGVDGPLHEGAAANRERGGIILGYGVPLTCYAVNMLSGRRSPTLSLIAGGSALAGGYLTRDALLQAGNESSQRPRDYLRFTRGKR